VIPFLIRILSIRYLYALLIVIIAAAPSLRIYYYLHQQPLAFTVYVSSLCRSDALALGVLAALLWRSEKFRGWLTMRRQGFTIVTLVLFAGMVALWYAFSNPYHVVTITIGLYWIACFYVCVLFMVLASPTGWLAGWARARWLGELGRVSFCVYLIHLGVLYVAFGFVRRLIPQITDLRCIGLAIVCAVTTYLIAGLSWICIEDPLIRTGHRALYKTEGER
jgi:peptidoglycan/LPS O-acetylase OafA/YrhL